MMVFTYLLGFAFVVFSLLIFVYMIQPKIPMVIRGLWFVLLVFTITIGYKITSLMYLFLR